MKKWMVQDENEGRPIKRHRWKWVALVHGWVLGVLDVPCHVYLMRERQKRSYKE